MIERNGIKAFGFFKGLPYGELCVEDHTEYMGYHNSLARDVIESHIRGLPVAYSPMGLQRDNFMDIDLNDTGLVDDGPFRFPIDFIRYYSTFKIGIPLEYEQYLIDVIGLK